MLLWLSMEKDEAIDLGNPFTVYGSFADMARVTDEEFPELYGVPMAAEQEVPPEWLAKVSEQAEEFLSKYGDDLKPRTVEILEILSEGGNGGEPEPPRVKPSPFIKRLNPFWKALSPKEVTPEQDKVLDKFADIIADVLGTYMEQRESKKKSLNIFHKAAKPVTVNPTTPKPAQPVSQAKPPAAAPVPGGADKPKPGASKGQPCKQGQSAERSGCIPKKKPEPKPKGTKKPGPTPEPKKEVKPKPEQKPKAVKKDAAGAKAELDKMGEGGWDDAKQATATTMLSGMTLAELGKLRKELKIDKPPAKKAELVEAIKKKLVADHLGKKKLELPKVEPKVEPKPEPPKPEPKKEPVGTKMRMKLGDKVVDITVDDKGKIITGPKELLGKMTRPAAKKEPEKGEKTDLKHIDANNPVAKYIAADTESQAVLKKVVEAGKNYKELFAKYSGLAKAEGEMAVAYREIKDNKEKDKHIEKWVKTSKEKNEVGSKLDAARGEARKALVSAIGVKEGDRMQMKVADIAHEEKLTPAARKQAESGAEFVKQICNFGGQKLDIAFGMAKNGRACYMRGAEIEGAEKTKESVQHHEDEIVLEDDEPAKGSPNGDVFLGNYDSPGTTAHELGHMLEQHKPGVKDSIDAFLEYRLQGEESVDLGTVPGGESMAGEKGRKNHFDRFFGEVSGHYVGKEYAGGSTEILSMGIEALHDDPAGFCEKDPEYAQFVIGLLRKGPKEEHYQSPERKKWVDAKKARKKEDEDTKKKFKIENDTRDEFENSIPDVWKYQGEDEYEGVWKDFRKENPDWSNDPEGAMRKLKPKLEEGIRKIDAKRAAREAKRKKQ
jgi:hypothetical protein